MSQDTKSHVTLYHRIAFWLGTALIVAGVWLHIQDYIAAKAVNFQVSKLGISKTMCCGMALIFVGLLSTTYGLFPARKKQAQPEEEVELHTIDNARIGAAHWGLIIVLGVALVVDVMKPATIGFAMPGMKREYGLTTSEVAMFPIFAMFGTTIGSILWGILADRMGRRSSILLASLFFMATAICGAMPAFKWNLIMCFIMGLSAGGMLPIVFALLAEIIPAKHRSWLSVLIAGLGSSIGYLVASGAAALLEPKFSWRILWLLNLPTGFLVILLSRFIPESPRFLLLEGRIAEARKMLGKFGIELIPKQKRDNTPTPHKTSADFKQLLRQPYGILTFTICFYGAAWGLVNWGFLTSLPVILQDYMHLDPKISSTVLAKAALIAVPGSLVVTWMYGFWSSKKTMILFALLTAAALGGFSMLQIGTETNRTTLSALTVVLLIGLSGMISMLSPYSAELYPTGLRGTGGGMAASSSKAGGIIGPKAVAYVLMAFPGFFVPALSLVAPLLLATFALWKNGRETRGLRLEEIVEKGNEASSVQPIVK